MVKRKSDDNITNTNTNKRIKSDDKDTNTKIKSDDKDTKINWSSLAENYTNTNIWVSGTQIRNYLLNDPIIDWLDNYYLELGFNDGTVLNKELKQEMEQKIKREREKISVLFTNGLIFEDSVFKEIRNKFPNQCVQVGFKREDVNEEYFKKTVNYMKQGIPIIMQAVLINNFNKTKGMADLLVRSDYINKLFNTPQLTEEEISIGAPKLKTRFHYRVIDIKWSTVHLCCDGQLIRNDERMPAYKGQLAIYNSIVGKTQGYYSNKAYIMGHSWNYEKCGEKFYGSSCFDRLGHIDYSGFDEPFISKTIDAIEWIRNMKQNGSKWKLIEPSVPELYPNMSNSNDNPWSEVKSKIANEIHELTQLWQVGPKNRVIAHANGIKKWSDTRCRSNKIGINGKKIGPILDKIIEINQSTDSYISPACINNNELDWQTPYELDFFIDFETINGCFTSEPVDVYNSNFDTNIIFLIGIGYFDSGKIPISLMPGIQAERSESTLVERGKWTFKTFQMNTLNFEEEMRIVDELVAFIDSMIKIYCENNGIKKTENVIPKFFHWSNAEVTSINIANKRHGYKWLNWLSKIVWIDLCKIFQNEPIVVKGATRFKLKDIAKNMYKHKFIKTVWDSDGISDGLQAMLDAIKYYKNSNTETKIMDEIIKYNEIDCKVMWEIVNYLRSNHTKNLKLLENKE